MGRLIPPLYDRLAPVDGTGKFLTRMKQLESDLILAGTYIIQHDLGTPGLCIAVLDYHDELMEHEIIKRSALDLPLWCFIPRGMVVQDTISHAINSHREKFSKGLVQNIFVYDPDQHDPSRVNGANGAIVRMVERLLIEEKTLVK